MTNEHIKQMMFKFLERNYPVSRVKMKKRFKRAVIMDDGNVYLLGDDTQFLTLQHKLMDVLENVFSVDDKTNVDVLKKFLHLK
jgi:hypothetical protein